MTRAESTGNRQNTIIRIAAQETTIVETEILIKTAVGVITETMTVTKKTEKTITLLVKMIIRDTVGTMAEG